MRTADALASTLSRLAALALALLAALAGGAHARADDLEKITAAGVLRWGCDAEGGAPYVYKDPGDLDRYVGFEVELAEELAKALGVRAERTQIAWDSLLPGLNRGDFDVALNGLEITEERRKEALFSRPYYISSLEITIRKGASPPGSTLQWLRGKKVATLKESFGERILSDAGGIDVMGFGGQVEPYEELKNARVDAVVMDFPIARYYGRREGFDFGPAEFGEARYGIAARSGQERLVQALDAAILDLTRRGRLREIYERYGIWNGATAELLRDEAIAKKPPVMLQSFQRAGEEQTWGDLAGLYGTFARQLSIAAGLTLALSVCAMALAVPLGLTLALLRLYAPAPLRAVAIFYIEAIRGTPLLIQLWLIFYALPDLGLNLPRFLAAVLGLGLNYAAYEAENYRAGLTSIPLGQAEAAHALGLTHLQTLRYVIVPQALRVVIPPVTNDFIALLKDSSIVSMLGMVELTGMYHELANAHTSQRVGIGLLAGVLYFLLGYPFARLAKRLEEKGREGRRLAA